MNHLNADYFNNDLIPKFPIELTACNERLLHSACEELC